MQPALPPDADTDDAFAELTVPFVAKVAGGSTMLAGAFTIGLAIQTSLVFRSRALVAGAIAAMLVLGVASIVTGWRTTQGNSGSAIAATITSALIALLGTAWAVAIFSSGVFSPLSLLIVSFGIVGAVTSGIAIGPSQKVTAARNRLRGMGLDLGL